MFQENQCFGRAFEWAFKVNIRYSYFGFFKERFGHKNPAITAHISLFFGYQLFSIKSILHTKAM